MSKAPGGGRLATPIWRHIMGRGILLWLIGVPIPVILLILLFWR